MKNPFLKLSLLSLLALTYSCDSDDPTTPETTKNLNGDGDDKGDGGDTGGGVVNEEEVITTISYVLTNKDTNETVTFTSKDIDGDGGEDAKITIEGTLEVGEYTGELQVLNETVDPADNVAEEIKAEDEDHQAFFSLADTKGVSISYEDKDANENPLGLETTFSATQVTSGTLNIILRHEPNKNAEGVKGGNIENAGGETDFDVTFNINVVAQVPK